MANTCFPISELSRLEEEIKQYTWSISVADLKVLLDASISLAKQGLDESSEPCQRFYKEGLTSSFTKLLNSSWVQRWNSENRQHIFNCCEKLIDLISLKLDSNCLPLLQLMSLVFDPNNEFHSSTREQSPVSKDHPSPGQQQELYAKPENSKQPRSYLIELLNRFGRQAGFQLIRDRFEKKIQHLSVSILWALIRPFGLCCRLLTVSAIENYFVPIAKMVQGYTESLAEDELTKESNGRVLSSVMESLRMLLNRTPEQQGLIKSHEHLRLRMEHKLQQISTYNGSLEHDVLALVRTSAEITLVARDGKEFSISKQLFMARSKVFRSWFEKGIEEKQENRVYFEDLASDVLDKFVIFLTTDIVGRIDDNIAYNLGLLSHKYAIPLLSKKVKEYFCRNCTERNADFIIELAFLHKSRRLASVYSKAAHSRKVSVPRSLEYDLVAMMQTFGEITLVASDGKEFPINKILFMARSKKFRDMFESDTKENRENRVHFKEIGSDVLEKLRMFLSTDKVDHMDDKTAYQLGLISHKYALPLLFKRVECYFCRNCNEKNEDFVIELSRLHKSKNLALAYAGKNLSDLSSSLSGEVGSIGHDLLAFGKTWDPITPVITLVARDAKEFSIGKIVFMARCEAFRAMFEHDTKEKRENRVHFEKMPSNVLEKFVMFLKTDKVDKMDDSIAHQLGLLAHQYDLPLLFKLVEDYLCKNCNKFNVDIVIELAYLHKSPELALAFTNRTD